MAAILVTTVKRFIGTAAERAALDTTGLQAGSTFFETDTKRFYIYSGAAWVEKPREANLDNLDIALSLVSSNITGAGAGAKTLADIVSALTGTLTAQLTGSIPAGTAAIGTVKIVENVTLAAPTSVNVTTSSTQLKAANANRKYLLIQNLSDTMVDVVVGGAAVAGAAIRLAPGTATAPGGSYEMCSANGNLDTRVVNAIHAGVGNKAVVVIEGV